MTVSPDTLVDARGHRCPVPTLMLQRALRIAPPGAVVRMLADDPLARVDIPHFTAAAAVELMSIKVEDGVVIAVIRKPFE